MDLAVTRAKALANLKPLDTRGFGLGALPLNPNSHLYDMASLSEVATALLQAIPPEVDLWNYIEMIYNQGSLGSCVAHSIAAMQSIFQNLEHGWWMELDAVECYYANGGDGTNGINTDKALTWNQQTGMRFNRTQRRYRIGSFGFTDPRTDAGVAAIKAAVAAKRPCVVALLLPSDFWNGDCGTGAVTSSYHQVCITGYTSSRFLFVNSWGVGYGNGGFGSMPWDFLRRPEQLNFTYAYTATDAIDANLRPLFEPNLKIKPMPAEKRPESRNFHRS